MFYTLIVVVIFAMSMLISIIIMMRNDNKHHKRMIESDKKLIKKFNQMDKELKEIMGICPDCDRPSPDKEGKCGHMCCSPKKDTNK